MKKIKKGAIPPQRVKQTRQVKPHPVEKQAPAEMMSLGRQPADVLHEALLAFAKAHGKGFAPRELTEALEPLYVSMGFRKRQGDGQSLLIVRDDAAGDFVCFSAFLRECRRIYPKARITLLVSARNQGLTPCCPYVDEVLKNDTLDEPIGQGARPQELLLRTGEFAFRHLLPRHFDLAFGPRLGIMGQSSLMLYLSGARERVSLTQDRVSPENGKLVRIGWDVLLTQAVPFSRQPLHDVERNLSILESMTRFTIANREIEVWYTMQHRQRAQEALAPLFARGMKRVYAVCPGGSIAMKRWPAERFAWVCREIGSHAPETGLVRLGGPGDREESVRVAAALGDRAVDLTGKTSFLVSAAVIGLSELYIGDDTSLMHVAAAQRKPVLSVNAYAASLPMMYMSIPVRFAPYHVPHVTVLPREPKDDCREIWRHGCKHENEQHCILGVEPLTVLRGYGALRQRIAEGNLAPFFLK